MAPLDAEVAKGGDGASLTIKRLTRPILGFQGFWTAKRTLAGIEAMAMLAKGQGACRAQG